MDTRSVGPSSRFDPPASMTGSSVYHRCLMIVATSKKASPPPISSRRRPSKNTEAIPARATVVSGLGARLRQIRQEKRLSLRAVARAAQISASLLSKIELQAVSPSIVSLIAIADALQVPPGTLLDTGTKPDIVVRRDQRRIMDAPFCRKEYMMDPNDPSIDACELVLPPGGYSRPALAAHSGHDYVIVLKGDAVLLIDDMELKLSQGDYASFEGYRPHRVANRSRKVARVLWFVVLSQQTSPMPGTARGSNH